MLVKEVIEKLSQLSGEQATDCLFVRKNRETGEVEFVNASMFFEETIGEDAEFEETDEEEEDEEELEFLTYCQALEREELKSAYGG